MLANKSTCIIKNFITGFMDFLVDKKKREFIEQRAEQSKKPINKLRFVMKKSPDSEDDSDSDYDSETSIERKKKRREQKKKTREDKSKTREYKNKTREDKNKTRDHKNKMVTNKSYDTTYGSSSESDSDLSYKIYKLTNKQQYINRKKNNHDMNDNYINCHPSSVDCSYNIPSYCNQDYYDFLEFKRLHMNETIASDKSINVDNIAVRTPFELSIPVKSEEQNKLELIELQLDNLMSNDIDSLTSIMTIDYFDKILDILNSIKKNINTKDETIRNRLIMILHMIFSFITTNNTNVNLKKNITEITQKYNHLVDKIYPNNNLIQPLSREININLTLDPVYDLYVKRYGLPKGTLFDNAKILLLKAEIDMQGI